MKKFFGLTFLSLIVLGTIGESLCAAPVPNAIQVPDRAALQALLGGAGILEDFESYDVPAGTHVGLEGFPAIVDSTTIAQGQGPGLVLPGISLEATFFSWLGEGYRGAPSREVVSDAQKIYVDFDEPVGAFGLDMRSYVPNVLVAQIEVYAADDTTVIGAATYSYGSDSLIPMFVGWSSSESIGSFRLVHPFVGLSPSLDNLEFGIIVVPEPSILALCLSAMVILYMPRESVCRG